LSLVALAHLGQPVLAAEQYVFVGHGLAMHGDLKYGPDFQHFAYVNPNAPKGGEVKQAAIGTFDSFNPFIIKGNPADGLGGIYDTLTAASADEPFSRYGVIAETIKTPKDRSWVEFTLRPEARWHDGKPITVEDVIWTFNTLREKGAPLYRFYYASVASVEKTGQRSVKFTFTPGENRELPLIVGELTVLPKHYWEGRDFDKTTLEPPLGSGPYRIEGFEPGRWIRYRRVKDYWGKDLPVNVGRDNYDAVRLDYYRDATVVIEAFKAGEFDARVENSSKAWATAYDIPAVERGLILKEEISHNRSSGMQGFAFNTRRAIFQDPKVRRALAYTFDFEWSNKTLFYGQYTRTRSYFDNSELAATDLPEGDELELLERFRGRIPDAVFNAEYHPPATDGSGNIRANLREAVKLLRDAGWSIDKDTRQLTHAESGEVMAFEMLLVSPLFERVALPVKKNLERLGIELSVRTVDTAQYQRRLDSYDFDMVVAVWGQSLSPGNEQREFWGSAAADQPGGRNYAGIKDPAIDELIELVIAAPDRDSLVTRVRALDRVLQWGHWVIPHFHATYDRWIYWDKFGRPEVTPLRGAQFDAWWIDAGKVASLADRKASVLTQ
jgi:microcin C transport system substrate-binding protein